MENTSRLTTSAGFAGADRRDDSSSGIPAGVNPSDYSAGARGSVFSGTGHGDAAAARGGDFMPADIAGVASHYQGSGETEAAGPTTGFKRDERAHAGDVGSIGVDRSDIPLPTELRNQLGSKLAPRELDSVMQWAGSASPAQVNAAKDRLLSGAPIADVLGSSSTA